MEKKNIYVTTPYPKTKTRSHTHTHTQQACTCSHTHMNLHMREHTHTHTHTHSVGKCTHIHTCIDTHTHTHTHTRNERGGKQEFASCLNRLSSIAVCVPLKGWGATKATLESYSKSKSGGGWGGEGDFIFHTLNMIQPPMLALILFCFHYLQHGCGRGVNGLQMLDDGIPG